MNTVTTTEQLKSMRFSGMAKELENQRMDPATYSQMGFEDRLGLLVDAEWNRRQANKLAKKIHDAHLSDPGATIEGIEYHEDRRLDKAGLLRYASCEYINNSHHLIIHGAAGSGKTYIACALGIAACRKFMKVRYVRLPELLDELAISRVENQFKKVSSDYGKADLLILDDWLLKPLTKQEAYDLLEIIEKRTRHGATIFCSQYESDEWYGRLNDNSADDSPIADAIMDRIVNNAYVLPLQGKSMRERHGVNSATKS